MQDTITQVSLAYVTTPRPNLVSTKNRNKVQIHIILLIYDSCNNNTKIIFKNLVFLEHKRCYFYTFFSALWSK